MKTMSLKNWMEQAKEANEDGKSLLQISLETYITERLGLKLLGIELIRNDFEEEFRIVATNGVNEYIFENEHYEPEDFSPHQHILVLKEISGEEGVLRTEHTLWLKNDNQNDKFLVTPLSELLSGKQNDWELQYVVDYLNNAFKNVDGYSYKEECDNDLNSFVISLNGEITIQKGFSNTIQCDFHKERCSSIQIIFKEKERDKLNSELDKIIQFSHAYLEKNMLLSEHNISSLYQFLKDCDLYAELSTNALMKLYENDTTLLFKPLIIETDDLFSYHQIEVKIHYHYKKRTFFIESNYLFRSFVTEHTSVNEVKNEIKELIHLVQSMNPDEQKNAK